jgi:hypothetical protein
VFYAVNEALDSVPEAMEGLIERATSGFIPCPRDGDPDMMICKIRSYLAASISFVPYQPTRPDFGVASFTSYRTGLHKAMKHSRFVALPRG